MDQDDNDDDDDDDDDDGEDTSDQTNVPVEATKYSSMEEIDQRDLEDLISEVEYIKSKGQSFLYRGIILLVSIAILYICLPLLRVYVSCDAAFLSKPNNDRLHNVKVIDSMEAVNNKQLKLMDAAWNKKYDSLLYYKNKK